MAPVPRSSVADAECTCRAGSGTAALLAEQTGPHFRTGDGRQRDRSGLPHRLRPGFAASRTALHHRQSRRRGGTLAPAAVAKADPDGYTLLSHSPSLTIFPATHSTLPYDTEGDFTGVVALVNTPFLLVVSPEKYKTARELVAAAQAKPGALNYASVGHGGAAHINAERFRLSAGIDVQEIPFRGVQEALTELLAGRVDFFFTPVLPSMSLIRDGRIFPLAVSSNKRISSLPDLPTLAEAGYPDFDFPFWIGVFAPSKTPKDIQGKLYRETAKALQIKSVQDKLTALGGQPFEMTSSEFDAFFRAQIKQNRELVKAADIKPH